MTIRGPHSLGVWIPAIIHLPLLLGGLTWILWRDGTSGLVGLITGGHAVMSLAGGLLLGGLTSLVLHGTPVARTRSVRRMRRVLRGLIGPLRAKEIWTIAIASGFAEEALFRGAIQPDLGLVLTSLLFGALHLPPSRRMLAWPVLATILGFALGGLLLATGNLLGPILAHGLINFVSLRRLAAQNPSQNEIQGAHPSQNDSA